MAIKVIKHGKETFKADHIPLQPEAVGQGGAT